MRGVFLGDEGCCGATAAKCWAEGYGPLTRKIRQYLGPDAIIYANECLDITNPSLNVTEVPPDFDLISVDTYGGYLPGTNGTAEVAQAKKMYDIIFGKLQGHQRVLLVPGTFGCSNTTFFPLAAQDRNVQDKLRAYFAWAKADARIAGFNPWHFSTRDHAQHNAPCDMELGAEVMPGAMGVLEEIGRYIGSFGGGVASSA